MKDWFAAVWHRTVRPMLPRLIAYAVASVCVKLANNYHLLFSDLEQQAMVDVALKTVDAFMLMYVVGHRSLSGPMNPTDAARQDAPTTPTHRRSPEGE